MVGSLDRYSGVQSGGLVKLDGAHDVRQTPGKGFEGRIIKWIEKGLSLFDTSRQVQNRNVRQDFFVALSTSNRGIAQKYSNQLVGGDQETRPLSGRLVRQIMDEVEQQRAAVLDQPIGERPKLSLDQRVAPGIASIIEITTRFPERRAELREHLQGVIGKLGTDLGSFEKGRVDLARRLGEALEGCTPNERQTFEHVLGPIDELPERMRTEVAKLKSGVAETVVVYDPNQAPDTSGWDPTAVPERSILKKPKDLDPGIEPDNVAMAKATRWLSEVEDRVLDELSGDHLPKSFREMIERFDSALPPERQIGLDRVMHNKALDIEGTVLQFIELRSERGMKELGEERLGEVIRQGVSNVLLGDLANELRAIDKDQTLTPQQKGEVAARILIDLEGSLLEIGRIRGKTERSEAMHALFEDTRRAVTGG